MPPKTLPIALCALLSLVACDGGNPFDPIGPGRDGEADDQNAVSEVPEVLRGNVQSIDFDSESQSLTVAVTSLDTGSFRAEYDRRPDLDVPGYLAFGVQEDALDRLFIALVAQSADGSVEAGTVSDGGQFNRFFPGGFYSRDGDFDAPEAGQVSYAGEYGALTNLSTPSGVIAPEPGTPDALVPGQPSRVTGDIFLNANFADMSVNGAVYNRVLIDFGLSLDDIVLLPADIDGTGEFLGEVEFDGDVGNAIGDYGGIFGGEDAGSVAGVLVLTEFGDAFENEIEQGVFVLSQCNQPGAPDICDQVAE